MPLVHTTGCSPYKHPEFLIEYDDNVPEPDIVWLSERLVGLIESGAKVLDQQTIEIGGLLMMARAEDDYLRLKEPDFTGTDIKWVDGVSNSLNLLRVQVGMPESFDLVPLVPGLLQTVIIGNDLEVGSQGAYMVREENDRKDTGWFVGLQDTSLDYQDVGNLKLMSVYEFITKWQRAGAFLGFPPGALIAFGKDTIDVEVDDEILEPRGDSLFAALASKGAFKSATD